MLHLIDTASLGICGMLLSLVILATYSFWAQSKLKKTETEKQELLNFLKRQVLTKMEEHPRDETWQTSLLRHKMGISAELFMEAIQQLCTEGMIKGVEDLSYIRLKS